MEFMEFQVLTSLVSRAFRKSWHMRLIALTLTNNLHDHPLLKNHKLQRKPNFQKTVKDSPTEPIFGLEKIQCPNGKVPIRRITKDDLIQPKWFSKTICQTLDIQVAEMSLKTSLNPPYHGVSGATSIYNPRVKSDRSSSAEIWVQIGELGGMNKIASGWHVDPGLYGDNKTHIYSAWTSDNFMKTGCYNTLCPGFVQIDKGIMVGAQVQDTSVYDGVMVEMNVSILLDTKTNNWWVIMQYRSVGYFPASLFSNMTSADHVGWGGRTSTPRQTPSPPMGSGYLPDFNSVHACYFRNISYQDETGPNKAPITYLMETSLTDANGSCSDIQYYGYSGLESGCMIQFGGPGGANCGGSWVC
ncbi:uncharacterized protein LOC130733731 isoform X1 [Lotus japonicus]|uniref:uncharacterized protein LOC130733731 isoform X1 n=1 Tax=Lotus japonicus TaxID=34305 RepID=UPI00258DA984|nr:uncharacterized protein LOC130733731 isoform X1 [Lotus japonicus]XP_057441967.1 uncharacterized protein LOC130733731 isoform X1 [Lotus japonicus]